MGALTGDTHLEVIVTLHEPATRWASGAVSAPSDDQRADRIAALAHDFVADSIPTGFTPLLALSHLPVVAGWVSSRQLIALADHPYVRAVEPVRDIHALRTEGRALIRSDQLRSQLGGTGAGRGVAIVDTGINWDHPEFLYQVAAWADFTTDGTNGFDNNGHGTACAGIVAGLGGGLAPQAKLWAIKVLTGSGTGNTVWLLAALNDLYAKRNQFGGLHVVSMSLGGLLANNTPYANDCDAELVAEATAINQLVAAGIPVFVYTRRTRT